MFSLIIPSYKNAKVLQKQLPGLIAFLEEKKLDYELIIVDDGSDDQNETKDVAARYNCRYIQHPVNRGKGAAVRSGMLQAKGEFRLFTDADIPFEYEDIENLLFSLRTNNYLMAVGDRTLRESRYYTDVTGIRRKGSKLFSWLVARFVSSGLLDTQCGLKGFKASVAEDIFSCSRMNGFASDVEWIHIALKRKYAIKRLPVQLRNQENSSVGFLDVPIMLWDVLRIKWNDIRGQYAGNECTSSE